MFIELRAPPSAFVCDLMFKVTWVVNRKAFLKIRFTIRGNKLFFMTDRETIESLLHELATPKKMGSFFVNNATSDFLLIRPSGNPITAKGFEEMMSSGDVVQEQAEITKIHKFEFLSPDVAMCVFTLGAKFSYKGTPNDDLPTVTSIFKKIDGIWKIHWMQRSSGDSDLSLWN